MEESSTAQGKNIPCFRCGVCCRKYSPRVTAAEAERIAASLEIPLERFLERYIDDSWVEPGHFLLDTEGGACIFLDETEDARLTSCRIHPLRPRACLEWQSGLERKECLEGLQGCWGLSIDSSGRICGPKAKLQEFRSVLKSWGNLSSYSLP